MTDEMMALRGMLEKGTDADVLREMIGFAAQRLMDLEVQGLTGAAHGERSADRLAQRTGHYMPPSLLDSQLATLEPLAEDEPGDVIASTLSDWKKTPSSVQAAFVNMLAALEGTSKMQGAHGDGCHCIYCEHIRAAVAGARAQVS